MGGLASVVPPMSDEPSYGLARTGETDSATRAIRETDTAGPSLAENLADLFAGIVRVEKVRPFNLSPPITLPALS